MNTRTLPSLHALHTPWPLRLAEAVRRWWLAPRRPPHVVQIELGFHGLEDIGAPPEWRAAEESRQRLVETERASLRMHGLNVPLPSRW